MVALATSMSDLSSSLQHFGAKAVAKSSRQNTHNSTQAIVNSLRSEGTADHVARLAGKSPRTVERWMRGETSPPGSVVVGLMANSKSFACSLLGAIGLTDEALAAEEAHLERELREVRLKRELHARSDTPDQARHRAATSTRDETRGR